MAMSAIAFLRQHTAASHEAVDARFARFDLANRDSYRAFLIAHASALPTGEAFAGAIWPPARSRVPALSADLAALGATQPIPLVAEAPRDDAAKWGALYVVEGSRLGGGMLAKQVSADLPHAYLSAAHLPGEWRDIRAAIDAAGEGQDDAWQAALLAGAQATFTLYERAADLPL